MKAGIAGGRFLAEDIFTRGNYLHTITSSSRCQRFAFLISRLPSFPLLAEKFGISMLLKMQGEYASSSATICIFRFPFCRAAYSIQRATLNHLRWSRVERLWMKTTSLNPAWFIIHSLILCNICKATAHSCQSGSFVPKRQITAGKLISKKT